MPAVRLDIPTKPIFTCFGNAALQWSEARPRGKRMWRCPPGRAALARRSPKAAAALRRLRFLAALPLILPATRLQGSAAAPTERDECAIALTVAVDTAVEGIFFDQDQDLGVAGGCLSLLQRSTAALPGAAPAGFAAAPGAAPGGLAPSSEEGGAIPPRLPSSLEALETQQGLELMRESAGLRRASAELRARDAAIPQEDARLLSWDARVGPQVALLRERGTWLRQQNEVLRRKLQQRVTCWMPTWLMHLMSAHTTDSQLIGHAAAQESSRRQSFVAVKASADSQKLILGMIKPALLVVVLIMIGVTVVTLLTYWLYNKRKANGLTGKSESKYFKHLARLEAWLSKHSCSAETAKNSVLMSVFTFGGFAVLWIQGFIQPVLGSMACYAYLLLVIVGILMVIVGENFRQLMSTLDEISEILRNVKKAMHKIPGMPPLEDDDAAKDEDGDDDPSKPKKKPSRTCC